MTRTVITRLIAAVSAIAALMPVGACRGERSAPADRKGDAPSAVAEIVKAARGGRPVIFLGLDAADWTLLDDYIARGIMPNLAGLAREGTGGRIKTISPPLSPLIWTTMMTGTSPIEHGILDFVQFNQASGRKEPITSTARRMPAIWNMASAGGKRAAVFGMWATFPAESIDGLIVSDRLFTFLFKEAAPPGGIVFPPDREAWAREGLARAERAADYQSVHAYLPWLDERVYRSVADGDDPYAHPVSALRRMLVETTVYGDLSLDWIRHQRPDLAVVYIQATDTIGHVFAPYVAPRQPTIAQSDFDRYSGVPERFFRSVDDLIGRYRDAARDAGAVLMIASDHGFLWGDGRPEKLSSVATPSAARWHAPEGMYLLWGPGVGARAGHQAHGDVQQVCATLLALLGLPGGRDVNGDPLEGVAPGHAPRADYAAHYHAAAPRPADPARAGAERETVANLRSLGYIGASESDTAPAAGRGSTRTPGSYNNEGVILKERGKLPQAIQAFEKALTIDPNLASAQWNLSDVLYAMGHDLDRSDTLLISALGGRLPDGAKYVIGRAMAYQRTGNAARSLTLMSRAVAADARDPELWLFRGRYRIDNGDCRGAAGDFDRAVSLAPANAAAYSAAGLARLCLGDRSGARRAFEQSLRVDPTQPKIREYLTSLAR